VMGGNTNWIQATLVFTTYNWGRGGGKQPVNLNLELTWLTLILFSHSVFS